MHPRYSLNRKGKSKRRFWGVDAMKASYQGWSEKLFRKYLCVHELFCLSDEGK